MQLALNKSNISQFFSTKATRIVSYIALAVFAVVVFTSVNDTSAITMADLEAGDADTAGAENSGNVLNTPVLWTINFLEGTGGLFATIVAFIMTLYAAIIAKSLMGIIIAVGIGIAAVFGPAILMSIFGAII